MNDKHNEHADPLFFRPEEVDTQIDSLSLPGSGERDDAEFISYLHNLYATRAQEEQPMLNAIWDRIERGIPEVQQKQQNRMVHIMSVQNRREAASSSQQQQSKNPFFTRLGNLVATILIVGIIGASVIVFTLAHRHSTTGSTPTATVFPSKQIGTVVYTSAAVPSGIYGVDWSPDSKRVVIGKLRAESFDATTGKNIVKYGPEGSSSISDVAWSPDGRQVAVTSVTQTTVSIYDATTGALQGRYAEHAPQALSTTTQLAPVSFISSQLPTSAGIPMASITIWSPDGKRMATAFWDNGSNPIQVWDISTRTMLQNYTMNVGEVQSLAWSPDGKYILSSSTRNVPGSGITTGSSIQVWNSWTGQRVLNIEPHEVMVSQVAWSPDGKTIAYSINNEDELIEATSGKVLLTHHQSNKLDTFASVRWSPDGRSIASGSETIDLWDTTTGKTYYTFSDNGQPFHDFRWSPDGKYIASYTTETQDSRLQVWLAQ